MNVETKQDLKIKITHYENVIQIVIDLLERVGGYDMTVDGLKKAIGRKK